MASYAIGDVHGHYDALMRLLERVNFSDDDRLLFVGDLVNRGKKSLQVLRFVHSLGTRAVSVLGNHDFSLLVQAQLFDDVPLKKFAKQILDAPDGAMLVDAMRHWQLIYVDEKHDFVMTHAGVFPQWNLQTATTLAAQVSAQLRGENYRQFLREIYANQPITWSENLAGIVRWRFVVNAFCRMRFLTAAGDLELDAKMSPRDAPDNITAWFNAPRALQSRQIFGHWASLGLYETPQVACLDGGCAWNGQLIAFDVATWQVVAKVAAAQ